MRLEPGSRIAEIYGAAEIREQFTCNYEFNPEYRGRLEESELRPVAFGENDEIRAVEIPTKRFFIATLFQPQLSSSAGAPHPLLVALVNAASAAGLSRHAP